MPAVIQHRFGTADVLRVEEVPVPEPGKDQVLIQVEAASLNALDWHFVSGTPYLIRPVAGLRRPKRKTPGADVAGTVVAVGDDVDRLTPGDVVFGEVRGGACASYVTAGTKGLVPAPPSVSIEAAAATPVAGLTAVQALRTHAKLQPGERVLINGASGGVGTMAVQIAKALGAHVTGVCSTGNVDLVRSIGADRVIDYTADDFADEARPFDVILDNVGNRSTEDCLSVLTPEGRYVQTSGPKENRWFGPMPSIAGRALRFRRASQSFHQFTADPNQEDMTFLAELLESGALVPQIQRTIDLTGVADAVAEISGGHTRAKIVVKPTPAGDRS
jgi:NADPH:quinone reductase-like Zn-dependent oxidoreductase